MLAVVINEIHYDPDVNTDQVEFLELHNTGPAAVDLSDWRLDSAVDYTFPAGSSLAAGGYLVVTQNASDFQAKFGFTPFGEWETGDRLSNDGETIELLDANASIVDVVSYKPGFPWPTTGEYGTSLELINPNLDNDLSGSWRSSGIVSDPNANQSLIAAGSQWRYRKGIVANPPTGAGDDWRLTGFNEGGDSAAWQDGNASIGYGDGDDATLLNDMRFGYSTLYTRQSFELNGAIPNTLDLRVYVDDGAIITINGDEVARLHVTGGNKNYNSLSGFSHDAEWESLVLNNASQYLVPGENTIAVHVLNSQLSSSDLSFNLELSVSDGTSADPTPGAINSVFAANAAPQLRQLNLSSVSPQSGEDVVISIKATDSDGVQGIELEYQLVDPGNYVRLGDAAYDGNWTTVVMRDDGTNGDITAGDDTYSATLPGSLQTHRRLIRYRITTSDMLGASVRAPYADDPQQNFAYFVYDGVPDYTASLRPGVEPNVVYSGEALDDIATYHLLANANDVTNSQYNGQFNEVQFRGTLVYNGEVYDHVLFRNRGVASTYRVGKNKWKIDFLQGRHFQAYDNYGNPYKELWDEINILPGTNPWWRDDVSTEGTVLFEPAAFKLYELAGAPSPQTNYFQFRVIDGASETGADQYGGDFWGLYIAIEQPDGSFLDERDLEDGNIYNMQGEVFGGTNQRHQGSESPTDRSDLASFLSGIDGGFETLQWWEQNLNWDVYFAWNIINHVVNNSDIRPNVNVNYYRNQVTGQWHVIPWDLDLTFEDAPHHGNPVTNRENIRTLLDDHPLAKLAYNNRLREITDLLLNSGDAGQVIQELADHLLRFENDPTIVDANQAMWDYHPRKIKKGIWYDNFNPSLLESESFAGLVDYMQDFVSPGGYGYNLLQTQGSNANIPFTPTISYVGAPGFAIDELTFATTPFSDPQGSGTFANMEWRVAEVLNASVANYTTGTPYVYEVEGTWESGELTSFANQINVPNDALESGKTYRARVRMQDTAGNWSHWSDSIEFLAAPPAGMPSIAITELHYNPLGIGTITGGDLEFIELLNTGAATVDLSGLQIADFRTEPYVFDAGVKLNAGEYLVVARTPAVFESVYGTSVNLAPQGFGDSSLSNGGETVSLLTAEGTVFWSVTYDDNSPWPTEADGDGPSLEIINPQASPSNPANWRASAVMGGTPGLPGAEFPSLTADYDDNGVVDELDYLVWSQSLGQTMFVVGAGADGNADGVVSLVDYAIWRDQLGAVAPPDLLNDLVLYIDPATGLGGLRNETESSITLVGYSIQSSNASLLPSNGQWNSMQDQALVGWEEATPSSSALTELNAENSLTLLPLQIVPLGQLFDTAAANVGVSLAYATFGAVQFEFGITTFEALPGAAALTQGNASLQLAPTSLLAELEHPNTVGFGEATSVVASETQFETSSDLLLLNSPRLEASDRSSEEHRQWELAIDEVFADTPQEADAETIGEVTTIETSLA